MKRVSNQNLVAKKIHEDAEYIQQERLLDEQLLALIHTAFDPACAFEIAINVITAFLEQPQSSQ